MAIDYHQIDDQSAHLSNIELHAKKMMMYSLAYGLSALVAALQGPGSLIAGAVQLAAHLRTLVHLLLQALLVGKHRLLHTDDVNPGNTDTVKLWNRLPKVLFPKVEY